MKAGIVVFPGINRERDMLLALESVTGSKPVSVWHTETELPKVDLVVVPGGFSYGDYLRCGAIAARSPIMQDIRAKALRGLKVLGVCNGFQILCEAGLLPGALIRNRSLQFRCEHVFLQAVTPDSPFTNRVPDGKLLRIPVAHGEGCYFADEETLARLRANRQILWRYVNARGEATDAANPNGSLDHIAGVCNEARNVAGLMPHPERASESILGGTDGRLILESMIHTLEQRAAARAA